MKTSKSKPNITVLIDREIASEEILLEALNPKRRSRTRERAASHPCATSAVILKASKDADFMVVQAALENNNADVNILSSILRPILDRVRPHYSTDESLSCDYFERNCQIRIAECVFAHPNAAPWMFAEAMFHCDSDIRMLAARSRHLDNPMFALSVKAKMCGSQ